MPGSYIQQHYTMAATASATTPSTLPDAHAIRKTTLIFRAINHKLRQQILNLLLQNGPMTVSEIFQQLLLEQSVVSQHLAILRRAGFVKTRKEGKFVWYMVQPQRLDEIAEVLRILLK
ncbi:MAG: ArsR/SmtB family transcription factor [Lacibacter sp.]